MNMTGTDFFKLEPEQPDDGPAIETLLDLAFGVDRFEKSSYRLRENRAPISGLGLVLRRGEEVMGTIRFWQVSAGADHPALLLGPLAMHPDYQGVGGGQRLMREGLALAVAQGHELVFLVGDLPYYRKAGFRQVPPGQVRMPVPYDPARLLYQELRPGAFEGVSGLIQVPATG